MSFIDPFLEGIDTFVAWISSGVKQNNENYCDVQTVDSDSVLVNHDGGLFSIIELYGAVALVGHEEFERIHSGILQSLSSTFSRPGHSMQVFYGYAKDDIEKAVAKNFESTRQTAKRLDLSVDDLIDERIEFLGRYCSDERVFIALYTHPTVLTKEQMKIAQKEKVKMMDAGDIPPFRYTQNLYAALPELRDTHQSLVSSFVSDLNSLDLSAKLLNARQALISMRHSVDKNFTDDHWQPVIPGDQIKPKVAKSFRGDVSDILWPSLAHQLMPRDAFINDTKTCTIGDTSYATHYIDLFPKDIQPFQLLLNRTLDANMPWRISFLIDSAGLQSLKLKRSLSGILSFASAQNRLINDAVNLLDYIDISTDDAVIGLRVCATTWAPADKPSQLRSQSSMLGRALQGWGSCDVSEVCGDPMEGNVASMLAIKSDSPATTSVASFSDVIRLLPFFRPASPWDAGAILFRSLDGKLWPYQPGSPLQTTWIDIMYARPGSGKSVLSNAINLGLCLQAGLARLPRISIIDIGPSSSGLISLLQEALPEDKRHLAAYHRLQMTPDYAINPFDTQLGCRYPLPQERSFLVNFVTLLTTPVNAEKTYDGMSDMVGLVIDEAYKQSHDTGNPNTYNEGVDEMIDALLAEISFVSDDKTTWWEVVDALFLAGFKKEAMLAQRNAVPLLNDLTSIARLPAVEDLYGNITISTGESLIASFVRLISSAIREYPILSRFTKFDIGAARVVSLDLDEVAKTGGDAADRQTAVMYMLARFVLAKQFYLNKECLGLMPESYRSYHERNIKEIREDHKRLVMDEFHRTAKAKSVRDQVLVDMREGRKWNVQIALISQSIEDFSEQMIDFATSTFILDAGPEQSVKKTTHVFGLSQTAQTALKQYVRGPREGGSTFLGQFATKDSIHTQLLTLTLGPNELWAFTTTAEDVVLRNNLYEALGASEARTVLSKMFPSGSSKKYLKQRMKRIEEQSGVLEEKKVQSLIEDVAQEIIDRYHKDPKMVGIDE